MSDKAVNVKTAEGKEASLPRISPTHGPDVVDVRSLYKETGLFTYDPGFATTASCKSAITFIDGDEGILLYRGYPIEQLAEHSNYLEVCYLLMYGELPTPAQSENFNNIIRNHTMVHENIRDFIDGFRYDAHPMAMLVGTVGAMSSFSVSYTHLTLPTIYSV